MKTKIFSILLLVILLFQLTACGTKSPEPQFSVPLPEFNAGEGCGFTEFDSNLIQFLDNQSSENYIMSPLSFKYALCLATVGAEGETQKELLDLLEFESVDQCLSWANQYNEVVKNFNSEAKKDNTNAMLEIANSVWHNTDKNGTISKEYIKKIEKYMNGFAYNTNTNKIVSDVNKWVDKNTKGMIKEIINDTAKNSNTILVNTLYLKSGWLNEFHKNSTQKRDFKTKDDKIVQKDFMQNTDDYRYYKDDNTEMVTIALDGDVYFTAVMGDNSNIYEKIKNQTSAYINLYIPKIEIETSLDKGELKSFLSNSGLKHCISPETSNFSNMIDTPIHINDIIQKAKIITDEEGLEASAATAIIMEDNAVMIEDEPKDVFFDKPFTFYIYNYNTNESPEIMFYGNFAY